jgi:hypothetical protein
MMTYFLKRGLPFVLTLMVGSGLGSLFGFNNLKSPTTDINSGFGWEQHHHYHSGCRGRDFSNTTPLVITFQPSTHLTPDAVLHKTSGVVKLLVSFNANGTATVENRLNGLPDGLTEEAESVAERTQFTPEKVNGEPVTVFRAMTYFFEPDERATMGLR